jgi:AmmeMemoRadiSam system protein A
MAKVMPEAEGLQTPEVPRPDDPTLDQPARLFVSWHDGPALIGCIGTLEPIDCLEAGVTRYAVLAGLHDRRTPMPDPGRWTHMSCEISILGEPRPLPATGIKAIAPLLVRGRDGVILSHEGRRAFYLPVVWEKLGDPLDFLRALCRKAGVDPVAHGEHVHASVLDVEAFGE